MTAIFTESEYEIELSAVQGPAGSLPTIANNRILGNSSGASGLAVERTLQQMSIAGTGLENTFTEAQTFTNRRNVATTDAGAKFNFREKYIYNTFDSTCEDHIWYQSLNEGGSVLTHPVFGIGVENFYITNTGQKLVEVNWDYQSIDRSVQYRPLAFSVDCDTHLANYRFHASRTVNTRTTVNGNYLVDDVSCDVNGVLSRQLSNLSTETNANTYDYIVSNGNDAVTVWTGDNGNAGYVGVDGSASVFVIGLGNTINANNFIELSDSIGTKVKTTLVVLNSSNFGRLEIGPQTRIVADNENAQVRQGGVGSLFLDFASNLVMRRTSNDSTVASLTNSGVFQTLGDVVSGVGVVFATNNLGTQQWRQYRIDGDPNLYLRDLINSRMHVSYLSGADANAANTTIHSRLSVDSSLNVAGAGLFGGSLDARFAYWLRDSVGNVKWRHYVNDGDPSMFLRDEANARMHAIYTAGVTSAEALTTIYSKLVVDGLCKAADFTVATLPSASANAGFEANVTDSSVTTLGATVAGGGSSRVKVYSNGTNWTVQAV